jgi:hypothetical protein
MHRRRVFFIAVAATAFGLGIVSKTQAEALDFNYVATVSAVNGTTPPPAPGVPGTSASSVILTNSGNTLTYIANTGAAIDPAVPGGADIDFGNIQYSNTGLGMGTYQTAFTYTIQLEQVAHPGTFATYTIQGTQSGFDSGRPAGSINTNSPFVFTVLPPQTQLLGGTPYTLSFKFAAGPGSSGKLGTLTANVTAVPEPTSMALMGLGGLGSLGLFYRRRKASA